MKAKLMQEVNTVTLSDMKKKNEDSKHFVYSKVVLEIITL